MGYVVEGKWKGRTVVSKKKFKTKAAAKKFIDNRLKLLERREVRAVKSGNKNRLGKVEAMEHAVMKAKIIKVA
jgi:hypothetical protein